MLTLCRKEVTGLSVHPTGLLALSTSRDDMLRMWNMAKAGLSTRPRLPPAQKLSASALMAACMLCSVEPRWGSLKPPTGDGFVLFLRGLEATQVYVVRTACWGRLECRIAWVWLERKVTRAGVRT